MFLKPGQRPDHGFDEPLGLLGDCHRRIEHFLEVLAAIGRERRGGPLSETERAQLEGALTYFATAAPRHTADEEDSLFPRLRASENPDAAGVGEVLDRLEEDHGEAEQHHRTVDLLVRRWLDEGKLSPPDIHDLLNNLTVLKAIYEVHIGIEDHELFPAAGRVLTADELTAVGREMAARRSIVPLNPGDHPRSH